LIDEKSIEQGNLNFIMNCNHFIHADDVITTQGGFGDDPLIEKNPPKYFQHKNELVNESDVHHDNDDISSVHEISDDQNKTVSEIHEKKVKRAERNTRKMFEKVFQAHFAKLTEVLEGYWKALEVKMFSAEMIGKGQHHQHELLRQFLAGFVVRDEAAKLFAYCRQFIDILKEIGGNPKIKAIELEKAWASVDERFLTIKAQEDIETTSTSSPPTVHDILVHSHDENEALPEAQCLDQYIRYLRAQYNTRPFPTYFKAPLIHVRAKHFINLALVDSSLDDEEHQRASIVMQISGNIDEIQKKKKKIRIDDIGRLDDGSSAKYILIEGAPGIGKTTFAWELCNQWANNFLLQQWPVLILIQMRDKRVREAKTLSDLLYHPESYVSNAVCQALNRVEGKNVLLFFEGYDEVTSLQLQSDSIFQKLLRKELLPYAGIIVSSRPILSKNLCEQFRGQVQQHIQILGFTPDEIDAYISSACSENPKLKNELEGYLSYHPFIYSVMYVPLYCSIIIELYSIYWNKGEKKFAPRTLTDIYKMLVMHLLQRHLELQHPLQIENLPVDICGRLIDLGHVALQGIYNQQYIFDSLECDYLGMMQIITDFYKSSSVSYCFLHQTLQEFLAAFYITQNTPKEVIEILSSSNQFPIQKYLEGEHRKSESNSMFHWPVLLFTSGLSKLQDFPVKVFKSVLDKRHDSKRIHFHPALLQLLFETQSRSLISSVFSKSTYMYLALPWEMTPLDWFVLGYCIANSSPLSEWSIEYELDHIDTLQSLELLAKGVHYQASSKREGGKIRNISLSGANRLHQCIEAINELQDYAVNVTELTLGGNLSPGAHTVKVLQQLCKACPQLVKLQVSSHSSFISWHPLFERFSQLKSLETLELEASITKEDAENLIANLKLCSSLKSLTIWFNEDSEESYSCLVKGIAPLAVNKLLKLNIQRFAINAEIAIFLANSLASNECSLTFFRLTETSITANDFAIIVNSVVKNVSLESFEWEECDIYGNLDVTKLDTTNDINSNLHSIVLSSESTFEGFQPLFSKLAKLKCLKTFKISGQFSKTDADLLSKELQSCKMLQELKLTFMGDVYSTACSSLVKATSNLISLSILKELTLARCWFSREMLVELCESLKSPRSSLTALKISDSRNLSEDFTNFAYAISANTSLKSLILKSDLTNEDVICLASALVQHPCIENIEITSKDMDDQTKSFVKDLLKSKPTIKKLELSGKNEEMDFFKRLLELGLI
jgi:hypothetical protein